MINCMFYELPLDCINTHLVQFDSIYYIILKNCFVSNWKGKEKVKLPLKSFT